MNSIEFINKLYSKKYIDKLIMKVKLLGTVNMIDPYKIMVIRLATTIMIFIVMLFTSDYGYIVAPVATIVYYFGFNKIVLNDKIKKRTVKLENEAMHFFEVLTLSLETGRNLVEAIEVTTLNVDGILSLEFKEAVREVTFGKSLTEALTDMQDRIPSDTIKNIVLSLTEANLYGNSIIESLHNQIDYLREKRKLEVKGKISKIPVLISVISVLFFVPLLLILILGPVLLEFMG